MSGNDALSVPIHPSAVLGGGFALAVVCHLLVPWSFWGDKFVLRLAVGMSVLTVAFGVLMWAVHALGGKQQSPDFGRSVTALVVTGPYRVSRNPMYVAVLTDYLGFAALLGDGWFVVWAAGAVIALDRLVVVREERYLEARFGREYEAYVKRVRRWL